MRSILNGQGGSQLATTGLNSIRLVYLEVTLVSRGQAKNANWPLNKIHQHREWSCRPLQCLLTKKRHTHLGNGRWPKKKIPTCLVPYVLRESSMKAREYTATADRWLTWLCTGLWCGWSWLRADQPSGSLFNWGEKCSLCNFNCKWFDFLVFWDKDDKPQVPSHNSLNVKCCGTLKRTHAVFV